MLCVLAIAVPVRSETPRTEVIATLRQSEILVGTEPTAAQPPPVEWLPSRGRECATRGPYRNFCQGPRRAPLPCGDAAQVANELGLGTKATVSQVLLGAPKAEWVALAPTTHEPTDLLWPVEGGRLWRGFGKVRKGKRK
jgi:hypothetical protein